MMILLVALAGAVVLGLTQIAAARKAMTLQQRPIPVKVEDKRPGNVK
jgi:hypothetical protein